MKIGVFCARRGRSPDIITQSSHPGCRRRLKKSKSHISPKITTCTISQHLHTNFCTINPNFDRKSIHHIYKNPANNQKSMIPLPQTPNTPQPNNLNPNNNPKRYTKKESSAKTTLQTSQNPPNRLNPITLILFYDYSL